MRRAAKVDDTQRGVVSHLRKNGWRVLLTHAVGGGAPDAFVSRLGYTSALEIKSGSEAGAEMNLNEAQRRFRDDWAGGYVVAATPAQAERELSARLLGFRLEMLAMDEEGDE